MDSKLRCVFEMPVENEKMVSSCTSYLALLLMLTVTLHIGPKLDNSDCYTSESVEIISPKFASFLSLLSFYTT